MSIASIAEIRSDFELLDEWEDRYRYVIELGRALPPFDDALRTDANKVRGCASQVWLATEVVPPADGTSSPRLRFRGDSDAHIVRGLIAILFSIYQDKTPEEILAIDARRFLRTLACKSTSRLSAPTALRRWSNASALTRGPCRKGSFGPTEPRNCSSGFWRAD